MISLATLCILLSQQPVQTPIDWKAVDQILGRSGSLQSDVYRVGFPRTDLHVRVGSVNVKAAFALGSWVALKQTADSNAMLMGDLVLLESEVGPVMDALRAGGIEQTALHNHLVGDSPHVVYLHVAGMGRPVALATAIRNGLARTQTPAAAASAATPPMPLGLDTASIAEILGMHGKVNGGVYQLSFPRDSQVTVDGMVVPPPMGVATAINFQDVGGGRAATTGDFVLTAGEVSPVIAALRGNGIAMTALHSHMLSETPRLLFMHFWGEGDASSLARGLRAALDHAAIKRGS